MAYYDREYIPRGDLRRATDEMLRGRVDEAIWELEKVLPDEFKGLYDKWMQNKQKD